MVENIVEDFPRGGAEVLTPLETRKIRESAKNDVLFGNFEPEKKKIKKKKKNDSSEEKDKKLKSAAVDQFSFKYLTKGMLVLGYVKEIHKTDLIIGLPNSLSGYIARADIQSFLSNSTQDQDEDSDNESDEEKEQFVSVLDLFSIGQLIPVSIKELHPSKQGYQKITLSLLPRDVNTSFTKNCFRSKMLIWGMVQSAEDHGYVISIGKDDISGFLSKNSLSGDTLKIGMLKWFCIEKVNPTKKVLNLTIGRELLCKTRVADTKVNFNSLFPGQLVKMSVTEVSEDAICGKIFESFDSVIESIHSTKLEESGETLLKKKVTGRIIHINPKTKQVGISLIPSIVSFSENVAVMDYKIGDIIEDCEVIRLGSSYGLLFKLAKDRLGIVHISRISDEHTEKVGKKYKIGTRHKCRVLGYSALDNAYTLTLKKSDLEKTFFRFDDLKAGMLISGTVISLEEFGVLVSITKQIRGLCPKLHLSDINLKHPERKFEAGKKLKFRVLYVKPDSRKLVLTHKKTLLKSSLPLIVSLEGVTVGDIVHGFVSKIKTFGIFVSFYNEIKALLPKSEINIPKNTCLPDLYYIGQVLQCTVISVDKEKNKLVVSLKHQDGSKPTLKSFQRGEIVDGTFERFGVDHCVTLLCCKKEISLPSSHFSDFNYLNESWKNITATMKKDFKFNNLMVAGFDTKKKENIVSNKMVLVQDGCRVKSFEDLRVGVVCGGVVSHIMSYGIFVDVSPSLTGLIPTSQLADCFTKNPSDIFHVGQSVVVKVTEIDKEKRRFLITSKPTSLKSETQDPLNTYFSGVSLLKAYLHQRNLLHKCAMSCTDTVMKSLPSLIGEVIIAKVTMVNHDGVVLSYHADSEDVDVSGFIPQSLRYGGEFEIGIDCQCYIFTVDLKVKIFLATSHQDAIASVIKSKKVEKNTKFHEEKKINSLVADISSDEVTLLLPDYGYRIAYMSARKHLNETSNISKQLKISEKIFVKFDSMDEMGIIVSNVDDVDDISKIKVGSVLTAVIKGIKPMQLSVIMMNGTMHGRVHISNICDDLEEGKSILSEFKPQQLIKVKIMGFKDLKTHKYLPITHQNVTKSLVELSLKPSVIASDEDLSLIERRELTDYKKGESIICYITSVTKKYLWVSINPYVKGSISTLHFSDDKKELKKLSSTVKPGLGYKAVVIGYNDEHNCLELSRIGDPSKLIVKGSIVAGCILKFLTNGLLIELPNHKAGVVHLTEMHDTFEEEPFEQFSVHQIVRCKVLSVKKGDQIDLSLRQSRIDDLESKDADRIINGYDDIKEGDILRGYIKSCSKIGVFVSLSHSITGRVQIKNLSQFFVKHYADTLHVGRLVKAKILSIDPTNNHIDLSLRGKDVGEPDLFPAPKRKATEENVEKNGEGEGSPSTKRRKLVEESDSESDNDDSDSGIEATGDAAQESETEESGEKPCLQLSTPFDWAADVTDNTEGDHPSDSDDISDEEESKTTLRKKTKRQKKAAKKAEEEFIHKAELALLDTESQLESAEDFDRLILGSPNSSMLWIQYMAFHLHSAEIEKARSVAERALKTISFREEQEKLNIWVALLNLESMYGTSESLDKTFQNALKVNDPKMVYTKMVDLYIKKGNNEEAEKMYAVMTKKFRTSSKVWTGYGYFLMKVGQVEAARKLLQRSLKSLPQRKHIETIIKFAVMEYKMGEPNRGATIFESILKNYPKRTNLWSIYIDMNIKLGDVEQVRNTFERATSLVLSSKKMKFLFKRYLTFEEQYGNKSSVEAVKKKALEYVENKMVEVE